MIWRNVSRWRRERSASALAVPRTRADLADTGRSTATAAGSASGALFEYRSILADDQWWRVIHRRAGRASARRSPSDPAVSISDKPTAAYHWACLS